MTMPTFIDSVIANAAQLNAIGTRINALNTYWTGGNTPRNYLPVATAKLTANKSIGNSADTVVSFDAAGVNNDTIWAVGSPTLFTIKTAGTYLVWALCHWGLNSTGARMIHILKNSTVVSNTSCVAAGTNPGVNVGEGPAFMAMAQPLVLVVNDVLRLSAWQNSGAPLNLTPTLSGTFMSVIRIGN